MLNRFTSLAGILLFANCLNAQNYKVNGEVYFTIADQEVILPTKSVRFAKAITECELNAVKNYSYQIKKKEVLGKVGENEIKNYIGLGYGDFVVFKLGKNKIKDQNGADVYVFTDESLGKLEVAVSKDNKSWLPVGIITLENRHINLAGKIPFQTEFCYIKLKSISGNGQLTNVSQVAVIKKDNGELGIRTRIIDRVVYTQSANVSLLIRDFRQFDFDQISVRLNGRMIAKEKIITKWNRFVTIPLKVGENKLVVRSISEGWIKPTTIDLKIVDGIKINLGTYRMRRGKTKTISIVRE